MLKILVKIISLLIGRVHFSSLPLILFWPSLFFLMQSSSPFWKDPIMLSLSMSIQSSITQIALSTPTNVISLVIIIFTSSFSFFLFLRKSIFVFDLLNITKHFVLRIVGHCFNRVYCSSRIRNQF